jgi:hypothetical protein
MTREEMRDLIAERLTRNRTNGLCPLNGPCDACDCFDPQHPHERDDAEQILMDVWPEVERQCDEVRREIDKDIIIPERRMHEETIQRAERAEAKQQAVADLIARARRRPGNGFVPIELLEIAAADQPTETERT